MGERPSSSDGADDDAIAVGTSNATRTRMAAAATGADAASGASLLSQPLSRPPRLIFNDSCCPASWVAHSTRPSPSVARCEPRVPVHPDPIRIAAYPSRTDMSELPCVPHGAVARKPRGPPRWRCAEERRQGRRQRRGPWPLLAHHRHHTRTTATPTPHAHHRAAIRPPLSIIDDGADELQILSPRLGGDALSSRWRLDAGEGSRQRGHRWAGLVAS